MASASLSGKALARTSRRAGMLAMISGGGAIEPFASSQMLVEFRRAKGDDSTKSFRAQKARFTVFSRRNTGRPAGAGTLRGRMRCELAVWARRSGGRGSCHRGPRRARVGNKIMVVGEGNGNGLWRLSERKGNSQCPCHRSGTESVSPLPALFTLFVPGGTYQSQRRGGMKEVRSACPRPASTRELVFGRLR